MTITNQTLTITITSGSVDSVIRKDNCRVDTFGDYVRLTDYTGERYEFLFSDIANPSTASAVELAETIEEFFNTGGGVGGSDSIGELTGDVTAGPAISPAQSVSSTLKTNLRVGSVGVTVDGVTSVIQVGQVGYVEMPYAGSITNWSITGNATGSIVFDVWKASGVIPTVANTMIGLGTKPSLSSQQINLGVPTGWTTINFLAGDILGFYVDSASILKRATLTLRTNKS